MSKLTVFTLSCFMLFCTPDVYSECLSLDRLYDLEYTHIYPTVEHIDFKFKDINKDKSGLSEIDTLGITVASPKAEVQLDKIMFQECERFRVILRVGYTNLRISVSEELKSNTCAYGVVLDHEKRHAGRFIATQHILRDKILKALPAFDNEIFQETEPTIKVSKVIEPIIKEAFEYIYSLHDDIDDLESSNFASKSCNEHFEKIVNDLINQS